MPFLSIIIPTHNNEEHIEQAINSCFDSDFDDLEIIVVNDASTDKTEEKIKKLQEQYPSKLKLITSESQIGPGPARNLGLEQASGEYLMFLDGDDWFESDAIQIVEKKLKEIEPDVLMFNHQRTWPDGKKQPNIPNRYVDLSKKEYDLSNHNDRVKGIENIHSACNKCYKRELIELHKMTFTSGYYEDLPWSILLCIKAESFYYIANIIFNYRQRKGSITRSKSKDHLAIFEQFDLIFEKLKLTQAGKNYQNPIYKYAKNQIFGLYRTNYRLHKNDKKTYLRKTKHALKKWKSNFNNSLQT